MKYKLSEAGNTLRNQINKKYPKRKKESDGWIGDAKHKNTKSDHNPDIKTGYVRAIDVDSDLGIDSWLLADEIRKTAITDKRIKYVIHNKKIASLKSKWKWEVYKGKNPHTSHIHISFTELGDQDKSKFNIIFPDVVNKKVKTTSKTDLKSNTDFNKLITLLSLCEAEINRLKEKYSK